MRGERRRGRKTSVTGRGQKAEEEYEFRDEKGQQKGKGKQSVSDTVHPSLLNR